MATPELPRLGPQGRGGTLAIDELNRALDGFFTREKIAIWGQPLLRSAALFWHDHLDASHAISQNIETGDGSWLHGLMHRREPDYANAKYWFGRVGRHQAFPKIAPRLAALLHNDRGGLAERLIDKGEWKPFAFIDECERAEQGGDATLTAVLQQIQAAEFDVLVEYILSHPP